MNAITEAAKEYCKQKVRQMEYYEILERIHKAVYYLTRSGIKVGAVVMSRDVYGVLAYRGDIICHNVEQKRIEKIYGLDVKIAEGKGILVVGYDALGGEFE